MPQKSAAICAHKSAAIYGAVGEIIEIPSEICKSAAYLCPQIGGLFLPQIGGYLRPQIGGLFLRHPL